MTPAPLSPSQTAVMRLAALGLTMAEIGKRLYVSESTVKTHLAVAYGRLGARNRVEALDAARRLGLLPPVGQAVETAATALADVEGDLDTAIARAITVGDDGLELRLRVVKSGLSRARALLTGTETDAPIAAPPTAGRAA